MRIDGSLSLIHRLRRAQLRARHGSLSRALILAPLIAGCTSAGAAATGPAGGAVAGPLDTHCAGKKNAVDPASCHPEAGALAADDGGVTDFSPTMSNAEGDDDDCKYHVKWTSTPIRQNTDVTFTLTVSYLTDGKPASGADPNAEVYLDDEHPAPNTSQAAHEIAPGAYSIGPVRFDAPGKWTVRFHLFQTCDDGAGAPHGHAAFTVSVP